jgi:hypothetical protein
VLKLVPGTTGLPIRQLFALRYLHGRQLSFQKDNDAILTLRNTQ